MNLKSIGYWTATILLAFVLLSGGVGQVLHASGTLETVQLLGYPAYFLTIIGCWKLLAVPALLVPGFPRLKEWTYAGIVFEMTGAAASHAMAGNYGDYGFHVIVGLGLTALAIASWALRPQSRTLGSLFGPLRLATGPRHQTPPHESPRLQGASGD
jgi:DoxX-like family